MLPTLPRLARDLHVAKRIHHITISPDYDPTTNVLMDQVTSMGHLLPRLKSLKITGDSRELLSLNHPFLDESFKGSLELDIQSSDLQPHDDTVMNILAQRSPNLESLSNSLYTLGGPKEWLLY